MDILSTRLTQSEKFIMLEREDMDLINSELKMNNLKNLHKFNNGNEKIVLKSVPVNQVKKFEKDYIDYLNAKHRDTLDVLKSGKLTPETIAVLEAAAEEISKHFE